MNPFTKTVALIAVVIVLLFVVSIRHESPSNPVASNTSTDVDGSVRPEPQAASPTPQQIEPQQFNDLPPDVPKLLPQVVLLTKDNFEQFALECLGDQPCQLTVDPMELYQDLKSQGHTDSQARLISYLKKELGDPELHEKYKDVVHQMIDDFYPPSEKQFQQASYADAMGDYAKALDLYLELDHKAAADPSLRKAPRLYLANLYYKLGQDEKARDFYRQAKAELVAGQTSIAGARQADLADFIDRRLSELRARSD